MSSVGHVSFQIDNARQPGCFTRLAILVTVIALGPYGRTHSNQEEAIELLQELGLKEYEAKLFVALSRLPNGTAKEVSEISDVPRTRVYDAIRVLETKGLVEIQHSNPQKFRAVPVDEAVETLKEEYDTRTESLRRTLREMEAASIETESKITHEVWSLSGHRAITTRTQQLIGESQEELVLVIGDESAFDEELVDSLQSAQRRGVDVIVGTTADELRDQVAESVSGARVFVSGLEWLAESDAVDDTTEIGRLLLVDQSTILVSTLSTASGGDEKAVFGRGFDNGFVTIARRLMATGLISSTDPGLSGASRSGANE